jgi:hypothetical protein
VADAPNNMPDITELINALFTNHPHPDGREVTALEITLATNGRITQPHLHGLRSGRIKDPQRNVKSDVTCLQNSDRNVP